MTYTPQQTQAMAEVAGAFDDDNSQIAALQAGRTADAATISDLRQQLAACKADAAQPTPPQPTPSALMVGLRVNMSPMKDAVVTFGKAATAATRLFQGTLPTAWSADLAHWAPGQIPLVSYKNQQQNVASYAKSLEAVNGQLIYHHEPEADYSGNGAAFVAEFVREYATAKKASPGTLFGMAAGGFQYRPNGGLGKDGSFLPPPESCDFYSIDTYLQGGTTPPNMIQPLETEPRFQNWYKLVKDRGRPLYITEYGRGLASSPAENPKRVDVIAKDAAYLKKIGVKIWLYWWTTDGSVNAATGVDWQFKDQGSIDAWKKAAV